MTTFFNAKQERVEKPSNEKISWRISAYAIVINNKGKLLMALSAVSLKYDLPGGRIELNESIKDGLVRECYEETGYKIAVRSMRPVFSGEQYFFSDIHKKFYHSILLFYGARLLSDKQEVDAINAHGTQETEKVKWMQLKDLNKQNCQAMHLPVIKLLQKLGL